MPKFIDRTGVRYGRLTAVEHVGKDQLKKPLWRCICDCGNSTLVNSSALSSGNTTSCGCYLKEQITKHGGWKKSSYNTWRAMMRRCYNPKDKDYCKYGAVGVKVYQPWHDYATFASEVGEPIGDETLDRVDPYGSYIPGNVRWAGVQTQNRNLRVRESNKTGITGVSAIGNKFMAKITVKKKSFYSKCFPTLAEAAAARKELEHLHWGSV